MGLPNPLDIDYAVAMTGEEEVSSLYGISMLHTLFNICNTLILVWFINYIVKCVTRIIKDKKGAEDETVKLKFIDGGHLSTAEMAVEQARNEVIHFAEVSQRSVGFIRTALAAKSDKEFDEMRKRLVKYEEIADRMEYEIAQFLNDMPDESISEQTRHEVKRMYKIIGELESLGDSGEAISRILSRRNSHAQSFSEEQIAKLNSVLDAVDSAYDVMIRNLKSEEFSAEGLRLAIDCEVEINNLRNDLREEEILKIERDGSRYQASVYYLDILAEIERMGDYIINVSQALQ